MGRKKMGQREEAETREVPRVAGRLEQGLEYLAEWVRRFGKGLGG